MRPPETIPPTEWSVRATTFFVVGPWWGATREDCDELPLLFRWSSAPSVKLSSVYGFIKAREMATQLAESVSTLNLRFRPKANIGAPMARTRGVQSYCARAFSTNIAKNIPHTESPNSLVVARSLIKISTSERLIGLQL